MQYRRLAHKQPFLKGCLNWLAKQINYGTYVNIEVSGKKKKKIGKLPLELYKSDTGAQAQF